MLMLGFSSGSRSSSPVTPSDTGYATGDDLQAIGSCRGGACVFPEVLWAPVVDRLDAPVFGWSGAAGQLDAADASLIAIGLIGMASTGTSHGSRPSAHCVSSPSLLHPGHRHRAWRIGQPDDSDELGLLSARTSWLPGCDSRDDA